MDCSRARTRDPGEWLVTCPDFSQPLAEQLVEWILNWEPDLTESIKWNNLCFSGRKLVCGIAACKNHLALIFFRGTELPDPAKLFTPGGENNTNIRSLRFTTLDGVNRRALQELLHAAVELDADPMIPPAPKVKRAPWPVPDYFQRALAKKQNRAAAENFRALSPSCQREYLVWLTTARRPETRARRLAETLAALKGGRRWAQRKPA
ncbi:MAG: YdeI/OmpD-associated family protein [Verrucomicrobia bacterium]|nr:YdeI/OmpD-associated family protein [Verrucomicrobiota bacterium]